MLQNFFSLSFTSWCNKLGCSTLTNIPGTIFVSSSLVIGRQRYLLRLYLMLTTMRYIMTISLAKHAIDQMILEIGEVQYFEFSVKISILKMAIGRSLPGVNFTNILWAVFAPKSFYQQMTNPNCKHIKAAQRALVWLSISPIFYEQLFIPKFFAQLLCAYNLGL